jgi:hypothetical protein
MYACNFKLCFGIMPVLWIMENATEGAAQHKSDTVSHTAGSMSVPLQLHIANEVILLLDIAQETRQLSSEELVLRQDLKIRILGLAALERCKRRQASRINYIRAGDACTRFFHLKMSARRRKQFIPALRGEDGRLLWKHDEMEHIIQQFFHGLIGQKLRRSSTFRWDDLQLGALQQIPGLELERPFTEAEV